MFKKLIVAAAISAIPMLAQAADMAVKYAPAPLPPPSWTGFYIGANIGGGAANAHWDDPCFWCSSATSTKAFVTGGGQIGYNYQFGSGLFGLEADVSGTNLRNYSIIGGDDSTILPVGLKSDINGTIRARLGMVVSNTLLYVTGGAAWANVKGAGVELGNFNNPNPVDPARYAFDKTLWGAVIGAGVEYMVSPNWIVGAEYLHTMYEHVNADLVDNGGNACGIGARGCWITHSLNTDVVRVRASYKFN